MLFQKNWANVEIFSYANILFQLEHLVSLLSTTRRMKKGLTTVVTNFIPGLAHLVLNKKTITAINKIYF